MADKIDDTEEASNISKIGRLNRNASRSVSSLDSLTEAPSGRATRSRGMRATTKVNKDDGISMAKASAQPSQTQRPSRSSTSSSSSRGGRQKQARPVHVSSRDNPFNDDGDDDSDGPCSCSKCDGIIDSNTRAMCCEFCGKWTRCYCTGLPEKVYDMILDNEIPNFIWSCDPCVNTIPTIKNLGKVLHEVRTEQKVCKEDITQLNTKVDKIENSIDDKIREAIDDYQDRENRKCNVIMHNVRESKKEEPKERAHDDSRLIMAMFDEELNLPFTEVKAVVRLGKKIPGKHRLTKVTLDSVKAKRDVLANAKKLHDSESWKRVFITPDLSPKERQKNKDLREELQRRMEEGEENLVTRRGQIVKIGTSSTASPGRKSYQVASGEQSFR